MEIFDNITNIVKDDLKKTITKGSRLSIAAACFSIYAFEALKKELSSIKELRFIFTSPTFIEQKMQRERREFYIPRLNRERSIYGSEFEIKLRNALTQKAIARECAAWIKKKVTFKSNSTNEHMSGFFTIESSQGTYTYMPVNGFTTIDIGQDRGNNAYNMITKLDSPHSTYFLRTFEAVWNDKTKLEDVTSELIDIVSHVYKENAPELIYIIAIYNIFKDFLEDAQDTLPNDATGFKDSCIWNRLYDFQKDAALGIISKLEKFNGCILADSVGLGKTFTALAVIKYYENRNKSVLVLCPKKIAENWTTFKANYLNNPIAKDRLRYDVLFHTDLSRTAGMSNGLSLERLNWGNYDLVVIDESHNFRNGGQFDTLTQRENRYLRLLNKVIRAGVKTKVLMLSATPVNNRFIDLKNQLALAYEGEAAVWKDKFNTQKDINEIFRNAQKAFTSWHKLPPEQRTTEALLNRLDLDFFEVLDSVTIARSRKHIEKYYNMEALGKFPQRLDPCTKRSRLTYLPDISYKKIFEMLTSLNLEVYSPSSYIFPSKMEKYATREDNNLTQAGREQGIRRLMSINLLKRLESSVYSFRMTLHRVQELIRSTLEIIQTYEEHHTSAKRSLPIINTSDFDDDDQNTDIIVQSQKLEINLADLDYKTWRRQLLADKKVLDELDNLVSPITVKEDAKLFSLLGVIDLKDAIPINPGNKKILIFTAFADTAEYLYDNLSTHALQRYGLHSALVTGTGAPKTTIPDFPADMNKILTCFSPVSKDRDLLMPGSTANIDILIATDCLSEGQNLQDCDYVINYDIHWNPVRIIQRFGRVDRLGSRNRVIQLVNFWPDMTLDEYINLKSRVETRMKLSVLTATGDDDPINSEEQGDLAYRTKQLEQLRNTVVDIEDISGGLSIMDLGLNEFRQDLLEVIKTHGDLDTLPFGMSAVVPATDDMPPGVIFVLRNRNDNVNVRGENRLHPFYMVYVDMQGKPVYTHLNPKKLLEAFRLLCKGRCTPDMDLCQRLNEETNDGQNMRRYSELLGQAIGSMVQAKEESDIDSLFHSGGTTALLNPIRGLDEYELICFLIIR